MCKAQVIKCLYRFCIFVSVSDIEGLSALPKNIQSMYPIFIELQEMIEYVVYNTGRCTYLYLKTPRGEKLTLYGRTSAHRSSMWSLFPRCGHIVPYTRPKTCCINLLHSHFFPPNFKNNF